MIGQNALEVIYHKQLWQHNITKASTGAKIVIFLVTSYEQTQHPKQVPLLFVILFVSFIASWFIMTHPSRLITLHQRAPQSKHAQTRCCCMLVEPATPGHRTANLLRLSHSRIAQKKTSHNLHSCRAIRPTITPRSHPGTHPHNCKPTGRDSSVEPSALQCTPQLQTHDGNAAAYAKQ